jgi:TolA-binding protein
MQKNCQLYIVLLSVGIIGMLGCSTKKNTILSRSYHGLTAHYNVYFNGNESYKKGIKRMTLAYKDDYTTLLPVFPFPNPESTNGSLAEMERAIKKASKTIVLHSITAKPNYKKGIKTKNQKEFYNKREYNKWIDDAYLLMGKANLIKGDMYNSNMAFRQIIKEYPKENTYIEAQIWLARKLILENEFTESVEILEKLAQMKKFPKKHVSFLNATFAEYYISKKQYELAIPKLEIAAAKTWKKPLRLRYYFVLGQLFQETGQMLKASEMFRKVIKMSPPYEMTFNARISLANSYQAGSGDADEIRNKLYKLLKDEKNKEYQDQIYYALGNLDLKEEKKDKAIENFSKSAATSVSNQKQKGKSFLAIADIKYKDRNYLEAQAYYDSTLANIDEFFPNYEIISSRAKSLTRLAKNLNNVSFEDSVQFVAKMSENERNLFIDQIIAKVKEKEAEDARKKQEEMSEQQNNMYAYNEMQQRSLSNNESEGGKWYFYNPSSKSYGESEFLMKWGRRKLEDNWRRASKKSSAMADENVADNEDEELADDKDDPKKKKLTNKSREYYMLKLPLTDSLMTVSHEKIRKSLLNAGTIYKDELYEYQLAANEYSEIPKRYPDNNLAADAYYQLYILYRQIGNESKAELNKKLLLEKFPESVYAKLLTNPNFIKELEEKENAVTIIYNRAYQAYNNYNFDKAIMSANQGLTEYPEHKLKPKFIFIRSLAKSKLLGIDTLRADLNILIKSFPKSEEAAAARDIIGMMDVQHPEIKAKEEKTIAKAIYSIPAETDLHYYVEVLNPKKGNANQLIFNLINYNLDNYSQTNLTAKTEPLGASNQMVIVRQFKSKSEAMNYFHAVEKAPSVIKDVGESLAKFVISEANFGIFKQDTNEEIYLNFFKENY